MHSRLLLCSMTALVAAVSVVSAADSKKYGAGVTLASATPMARLLEKPADYSGKTVRIEGVVTEVCAEMGCWMALAADAKSGKTVLIQVEHDGVIVFPPTAKGHRAAAQGIVERIAGGEAREAVAELAKQQGAKAEAPLEYRIKATGAVVY
jgi:hypothetical protein